ncbi:hypothetical protein EP51_27645 [Rhodococcus opacus]|uniref:Uncharacterized protein n=1 Tax=Rhodococcus opacus TaxID=37919 RepID=A0A076EQH8_RHOOP|nr:hypothetical protein EP51_27645 [Rhodococcus opacus]
MPPGSTRMVPGYGETPDSGETTYGDVDCAGSAAAVAFWGHERSQSAGGAWFHGFRELTRL